MQKSYVLWFTGLSGAGKTTLAKKLQLLLGQSGVNSYILDGDVLRKSLNRDLAFSAADRKENIRRAGEVAHILVEAGVVVLAAFISPYREDRQMVRHLFSPGEFIEIYVKCPLSICESRDPKGLYRQARDGKIREFTGISSVYEPPENPELIVETFGQSIDDSVRQIVQYLRIRNLLPPGEK